MAKRYQSPRTARERFSLSHIPRECRARYLVAEAGLILTFLAVAVLIAIFSA